MKKLFTKFLILIGSTALPIYATAQVSFLGNTGGVPTDYVGWSAGTSFPLQIRHNSNFIDFYTANTHRARVTTGNALSSTIGSPGDGLTILPGLNCSAAHASLDMWTSCSNGTNIRWGFSGEISGASSQWMNVATVG